MHRIEVRRHMGRADVESVSSLLDRARREDSHPPLNDHQWVDLVQGGREGFAGFVAFEDRRERPVGYAQLSSGTTSWAVEYVVDPELRGSSAIGADLVAAALEEVRRAGGGHVHMWVPKPGSDADQIAATNGLRPGRELYQMRRPLPLSGSATELEVRPFRPGEDEQAWLEVNNRAFAGHPEQGAWDMETLARREKEPWFNPAGFLLHEREGRLAGSVWTKVHSGEEPPLGEIYVISVDPDFQGLGLGRDLCVAGLRWLHGAGLKVGMLYVDSANTAAVTMYEHLGFTVDHVDRAYVGDF